MWPHLKLGASLCLECPEGFQCIKQVYPEPCPAGFYCPRGVGYDVRPCPVGTYGGRAGLSLQSQCTKCSGGSYCAVPGISSVTGLCAGGRCYIQQFLACALFCEDVTWYTWIGLRLK